MITTDPTGHRNYPRPVETNNLADDVHALRSALEMVDYDVHALMSAMSGLATKIHVHEISDINGLASVLDGLALKDHLHSLGSLSNVDSSIDAAAIGSIFYRTATGWAGGNPAAILGVHQHLIENIEGLPTALAGKLDTSSLPAALAAANQKSTPVDADSLLLVDSEASNGQKRLTWARVKAVLKSYLDGFYAAAGHAHAVATAAAHGFMSATDKAKLDGIAAGAQPTPGTATTSANGLMSAADKTKLDSVSAGAQPNPGVATTSANGLMSAADKTKLNGVAAGATANATDAALRARSSHTGTQDINSTTTGTLSAARGGTGHTTEAGMRGVYTGTDSLNTSFPIGATLAVITGASTFARNGTLTVRHDNQAGGVGYSSVGGVALAGIWRARGTIYGYFNAGPTVHCLAERAG